MQTIPVVENPRRRRRRRRLTSRQKAAGFGGRAAMRSTRKRTTRRRRTSTRRRTYTSRRRRRNPTLAAVSNPRRRYRRRRNPRLPLVGNLNFNTILLTGGGILFATMAPGLLRKVWPSAPASGVTGKLVQAGSIIGLSFAVRKFLKQRNLADGILYGGLGFMLFQSLEQYVMPLIGLSGYTADAAPVAIKDLPGMGKYTRSLSGMNNRMLDSTMGY